VRERETDRERERESSKDRDEECLISLYHNISMMITSIIQDKHAFGTTSRASAMFASAAVDTATDGIVGVIDVPGSCFDVLHTDTVVSVSITLLTLLFFSVLITGLESGKEVLAS